MTTTKTLLTPQERIVCEQISSEAAPDGQRAAALIALDEGATQAQASEQSGLTRDQVKYWLSKFRSQRLGIFPEELLGQEAAEETPEPLAEAAPELEPTETEQEPPVEIMEEVSRPAEKTPEAQKEPDVKGKAKNKKKKKSKKSKKDKKGTKDQVDSKKKKKSKKKKSKKSEGSKKSKGKKGKASSKKGSSSKKQESKGSKKKKKSKKK